MDHFLHYVEIFLTILHYVGIIELGHINIHIIWQTYEDGQQTRQSLLPGDVPLNEEAET